MILRGRRNGDAAKRPLFRPRVFLAYASLGVVALMGCRSNQKSALVEAELRTREREIRTMQSDVERLQAYNSALVGELRDRSIACPSGCPLPPTVIEGPAAVMAGTMKQITLGRGTGGLDDHGLPGDEALQVVVVPQDVTGSAVKVPGTLIVQAFEITPEGLKVPLSRWDVSASELQTRWRSGLFTTGYFVTLPWKVWPSTEKLRVVAQFLTLPDNRPFEAERDVRVKVMPGRAGQPIAGASIRDISPGPYVPDTPIIPSEPTPKPVNRSLLDDGPLLTPGAWLRERNPAAREAAKVPPSLESSGGARLLDPQPKPDEPAQLDDR